jgi:hypothetical protein
MTNSEAKEALKKRTPVIYNNIEYLYISAIIYRYDDNGNLVISAELADKCRHSVIIAQLKDVIPIYDNQNQTATFLS